MDQLKEILRQAIKYRFWIAVGISALVPIVAYLVGSGPVQAKTTAETAKIRDSEKKVKAYSNGVVPNRQYPPLVAEKTTVLAKDVSGAWKKLYARQAPLLTWPERVQDRFRSWGRKWPENEDSSRVQVAIIEYVTDYKTYVDEVYESFHPFNNDTGKGVVAAPPKETLLRPAQFKENDLPDLGKVWAAQERLWLQRTMLEVITDVNKNAKDWNSAVVRQINTLEVGNAAAQDQKSLAKGDTLEEAPAITDPKAPPPPEPAATESSNPMAAMGAYSGMMGGTGKEKLDSVFYLKKTEGTQSEQYKILPVQMSVLVEQSHVPDFLVALENSPMAIQVMEFEISKPSAKVEKPEKGSNLQYAAYGGNSMMDMMSLYAARMGGGGRTSGFGGNAAMQQMMNMSKMYGAGRGGDGPGAFGGVGTPKRIGVDKRAEDKRKTREEAAKKEEEEGKSKKSSSHDQYYNIISVTIYGQARFYNPPPPEPPAEPSQTETTGAVATEGGEKAKAETVKTEEEKPKADATKDETEKAKAETDKPDAEKAKAETDKPDAEKAKDDADKPDAEKAKDDADKPDAEKAKDDAPKEKAAVPKSEPAEATPKK